MGQKNRRDSRGQFAQPIVSPMNPEPNPPKLVSVSIKNLKDNPPGVVVEETDISSTNQTFGQNLGEALDQALLNESTNNKLNKTKEVTMSEEVKKNEVVETTNNATTTEAAPKKETAKAAPQKKAEEKKAKAAPAESPAAPAKQEEAPKNEETRIASGDTRGSAKQDLRRALKEQEPTETREVVIREEFDTGKAMLHNFGVGLAIGGGVVLGAAIASGVVYLVKRQFAGGESDNNE